MKRLKQTFEKVGRESGLVDGAIGHKLEPQLVAAAFDLDGFVITAEAAEQLAALRTAVPHLHVVVAAAVVLLDLSQEQRAKVAHDVSPKWISSPLGQETQLAWYVAWLGRRSVLRVAVWFLHLKGLEGQTHTEALRHCYFPYTCFVGLVLIRIVGRLYLTAVPP